MAPELVVFYNTENFYAPQLKQYPRSDIPKSGLRNWNEARYQNKLLKFTQVFNYLRLEEGLLPMLIGLAEIETNQVLEDIVNQDVFKGNYAFVHYDSPDQRGVDTALLYDKTKLELLYSEVYSEIFEGEIGMLPVPSTTRDILYARFRYGPVELSIYVLHLPSKRQKEVGMAKRKIILDKLQRKIRDKLLQNPLENIVVMGDFNENPTEANLQDFVAFNNKSEIVLINFFEELYNKKKFSTFHRSEGLLFDQIILSPAFLEQENSIEFLHAKVFDSRHLIERSPHNKKRGHPFRTYAGTRYLGGYSDHFPVFIKIKIKVK
ncbi:endonuclease [Elizabethkingia argentiflava]|uniref:Endonuclease n=1 Tax=Elizabethkingia argenteiflava TaxID=2681556 RepID=A0A845PRN9_9FLAO|nr:endonuclease [Elizabethkingia argenteiflava]